MNEITRVLEGARSGESKTPEELLPLVYEQLRNLAIYKMAREAPGQTLQPTALVHEAWLRLVDAGHHSWENKGHFFAAAAEAMRRILVERARSKHRLRHGGGQVRVQLEEVDLAMVQDPDEKVLLVHEALEELAREDRKGLRHRLASTDACARSALFMAMPGPDRRNCSPAAGA